MKPSNLGLNRCSIESLEARTLLSASADGVTPVLDFSQYNDPEIHCMGVGPRRPCLILAGRIAGQIFDDANGNGVKDAGEGPVEGAAVLLEQKAGDPTRILSQTITSNTGNYAFARLDPGEYTVVVQSSPVRKIEFESVNVTITDVETHTIDIGANVLGPLQRPPVKVKGIAFWDQNLNGMMDRGEPVLRHVGVFVDANGNGIRDANEPLRRSNAAGKYSVLTANRKFTLKYLLPRKYRLQGLFNRSFQIDNSAAQDPVELVLGATSRRYGWEQ